MPSFRWPCLVGVIASWLLGSARTTPVSPKALCPDGWEQMDGKVCMWMSSDSLSWDDALASCHRGLSHLLILHDQYYASNEAKANSIFNNIKNLISRSPVLSEMWAGVHVVADPSRNQKKLWWEADVPLPVRRSDNMTLFNWAPGQPDLKSGRCGAVINLSQYYSQPPPSSATGYPQPSPSPQPPAQTQGFTVTLTDCTKKKKFICVREATSIVANWNLKGLCRDGWYGSEYLDTCFKAFTDNQRKVSFWNAKTACEGVNGTLAIPFDNISTKFIEEGFKGYANPYAEFWVGLFYNNKTTVNGSAWPPNILANDCYSGLYSSLANCIYMKVNDKGDLYWCYGNCTYNRSYICQSKASQPDSPEAKVEPRSLNISATTRRNQVITCQASHYNPSKPVVWIKDGFYIDNGLPPQGLNLTLDENLLAQLPGTAVGSLQGEYRCEVWGQRSEFRRSTDDSAGQAFALVRFEDIATFRGVVSYNTSKWSSDLSESDVQANSLLYWSVSDYPMLCVSNIFGQLTGLASQLEGMKLGSVLVNFSLYYNYTIADVQALESLAGYLGSSQSGTTWQRIMSDRIYQLLSRRAEESIRSSNRSSTEINWLRLTLIDGCPEATVNGLTFKYTEFGSQANSTQICPFDSRPKAVAICEGDFVSGGTWTILSSMSCSTGSGISSQSTPGLQQLAQAVINRANVDDIMNSTAQLTNSPETLAPLDVVYTTEILNNVATTKDVSKSVAENFLKTVSNMAAVNETQLQRAGKAVRTIISAVNLFTDNVDLEGSSNLTVSQPNVVLQVYETTINQKVFGFGSYKTDSTPYLETYFTSMLDEDLASEAIDAAIVLSEETLDIARRQQILLRDALNWNENLRISFLIYQDGSLFSNPSYLRLDSGLKVNMQNFSLNSYVVSGAINGQKITNLTDPVRVLFKQNQVKRNNWNNWYYSPKCVYWENDAETGTWGWSTTGVWTNSSYDNQSVLGLSRHLTNFAIIAGFSENPDTPVAVALRIVSIIGISISIAGLSITILAQILFKALGRGRSQLVLLNLSVALLAVNILILVGVDRTENYNGCIAVAALLFYFLLASFCWMLVEGVVQYLKFVKVFDTYTPRFMVKTALPAWGVPLIPVILVAAIDHRQFRGPAHYCWLASNAFHYAFLLPLALIWMTNLIMFILIIKGITCDRPKGLQSTQKRSKLVALQVQAALCCCVVMGLTWLFCLLSVDGSVIAMDFLFCIFNSLQGFFIFLFLNVREKPIRQAWKAFFRRCCFACRPDKKSKKKKNSKYASKQSNESVSDSQDTSSDAGFCRSTATSSSQRSSSSVMELSPAEAALSNVETIVRQTSYYHF